MICRDAPCQNTPAAPSSCAAVAEHSRKVSNPWRCFREAKHALWHCDTTYLQLEVLNNANTAGG